MVDSEQPGEDYPPIPAEQTKDKKKPVDPNDMRPDIEPGKADLQK